MKLLRREKLMAAVGAGLCLFAWLWFRLSRSLGEGAGPMRAFGLLLGRGLCRIFSILPLAMAELVWIGGLCPLHPHRSAAQAGAVGHTGVALPGGAGRRDNIYTLFGRLPLPVLGADPGLPPGVRHAGIYDVTAL